jgi:hypothetical protein
MKKTLVGLLMIGLAQSIYASDITLKFLNCTGKDLTANWSGYKVNIDRDAPLDVLEGQFELPGNKRVISKTLKLYRANAATPDEHLFSFYFIEGISGNVKFVSIPVKYSETVYGNKISLTSSNSLIYLPKISIEVPNATTTAIADILIGCE